VAVGTGHQELDLTMRGSKRGGRFRIASGAIILLSLIAFARGARAGQELLHNADLSKGSENQPDDWRTEAWVNEPSAVSFNWTHPPKGGPGELEVNALKPDDARWMQSLSLTPGWYYVSAEIRTEDIGADKSGATISVMEDGIMSPEVKGTSNWTRVGFYLRVGKKGADVQVALRVGGFGSLNTGRAFYRNASATPIDAPPANAQPVYDIEKIRQAAQPVPIGKPYSLVLTYLLLIAIAYGGWYMFAMEPPKVSRAEARREAKKKVARR
jgi:dolichyl-phosphate-mannose-protein mannosyltransferase